MIHLKVNGADRSFDGDPEMPLLWYLRDELGLTGTKFGCGMGLCGACTVHLNGKAVRSCSTSMDDAAGKNVVTIEAIAAHGLHPVQEAWIETNVPAMRILPVWPDHAGHCSSEQQQEAH